MQEIIKEKLKMKEGALRTYIRRKFGNKAFNTDGKLKTEYLKLALKTADEKTKKRIVFALNMRGRK
jgi:hypothetical protein